MAESNPPEMREKPSTATSSGFKLPMPSPEVEQTENEGAQHEQQKPMSAGQFSGMASTMENDGDSGLFTFNRPTTRAGGSSNQFASNSSYYAAGSRLNTGIGISYGSPALGRPLTGRPLTATAIPEEEMYQEELDPTSPAALIAAAYRDGRAIPPSRGNLSTPVIELEERMRSANQREQDLEELSTPSGSNKTDYAAFEKEETLPVNPYDNMDPEELLKMGDQIDYLGGLGGDPDGIFEEEEDSPFPEVRASVSNYDDPDMPCLTFRAVFLGSTFTLFGAALNTYFAVRYPSPFIQPIVVQVITYPFGAALARILPVRTYRTPRWLRRVGVTDSWSFNPGPFNIKEHAVICIMASVGVVPPFGLHVLLALDKFYQIKTGFLYDLLLLLSSQMVGFVFAGFTRRFLIWPAALIWPQNLVTCTLLNTFHAEDDAEHDGSLSRYRYFVYVFCGAAVWYLVPGFLFVALSAFSWICWMAPNNPVVNQLFGVATGLGMSSLTFDWSQVAYIGSPLVVPWWAIVNVFLGFVSFYWLFAPILYYTNTWNTAYLPISVNAIFDRYGAEYDTSQILTPNIELNVEAYKAYSPVFLPVTYATVYVIAFALSTASLVHTAIYHGPTMWQTWKDIKKAQTDIHAKLMLAYRDVPTWWYVAIFAVCMGMAIGLIEGYSTGLPIWGLVLAVAVVGLYIIPGGFIFALSYQLITVNILAESIPGLLLAGKPIANMIFKCYSVQGISQGLYFIQDLKLGHYMKIPPRITFSMQILASVLAAFAQTAIKEGLLAAVPDLCAAEQGARLVCPTARSAFNASVIWGLIGPQRIFGDGSPFQSILWGLLLGAIMPLPAWLLSKRFKHAWLEHVNFPVMLSGASYIPPANGINYASWFIAAFIFQYCMRKYRYRWWAKFCFVTSAALDSGTAIGAITIFLTLQLPKSGSLQPQWWGNKVYTRTADWMGIPFVTPPTEGFGRTSW